MFKLSKNESDLVNCNLFPEDYNEYNVAKTLIQEMRCTKGWKFVI
jgi:hypothetical protein